MKITLIIATVLVIVAIGYTVFTFNTQESVTPNSTQSTETATDMKAEEVVTQPADTTPASVEVVQTQTTGQGTVSVKQFTMAEVAQNNTASRCYSVVDGSVYDLTEWIQKHPGGSGAITRMCGVDGSAGFNRKHGGQANPEATLEQYKIGVLAQ